MCENLFKLKQYRSYKNISKFGVWSNTTFNQEKTGIDKLLKSQVIFFTVDTVCLLLKFSGTKLTRTVKFISLWFAIIFSLHHTVNVRPFRANKLFFNSNYFQYIVSVKKKKKKTFIKDLDFLKVLLKK